MRGKVALAAIIALVAGVMGFAAPQANAQAAPSVTVYEGAGQVCAASGFGACSYDLADPVWTKTVVPAGSSFDGLFWPTIGPAARGNFKLVAGPAASPPTTFCVSSTGGPGCVLTLQGSLKRGDAAVAAGNGAYCGSSHGDGNGTFRGADGSSYSVTFSWAQSAATILPTVGSTSTGQRLVGFSSSRGFSGGGNCGLQGPTFATTVFQVEGMTVAF